MNTDSKELTVTLRTGNGRPALELSGRLTAASVHQLQRACNKAFLELGQGGELTVDLSALNYIDSLSIGMLIRINELAKTTGKQLALLNARGPVLDVLRMVHIEKLMPLR